MMLLELSTALENLFYKGFHNILVDQLDENAPAVELQCLIENILKDRKAAYKIIKVNASLINIMLIDC